MKIETKINGNHVIDYIKYVASSHFNVTIEEMDEKRRFRKTTTPRQVAHLMANKYTNETLMNIGHYIGKRDHTSVIHGIGVINDLRLFDKEVRLAYSYINGMIKTTLDKSHDLIEDSVIQRFNISRDTYFKKVIKTKPNKYMAAAIWVMNKINHESLESMALYFDVSEYKANELLIYANKQLILSDRYFTFLNRVMNDVEDSNRKLFKLN